MDFQVLIYAVIGVGYVVYKLVQAAAKKAEEKVPQANKPVRPPVANPFEEITRELRQRQQAQEAQKRRDTQQEQSKRIPQQVREITNEAKRAANELESKKRRDLQQSELVTKSKPFDGKVKAKDVLVHEKRSTLFQEGVSNYESTYEREVTAEDKIERGQLKVSNEGVYRIESMQEEEAREAAEQVSNGYVFNAREAIIGSIILERKF